ncbi:hypothetical protein AM499_07765 [Bacillus sp. FJAT-22090]|nr:hypothetical protein AM499_07765 [Bacillus sp. FJAT-22090]
MMDHQLDLSKVRDRGNKKWVAMMLPEHLKLIRSYSEEQTKVPRPILNEWDLEAIEETINIANKRKCDVTIKMWRDGEFILRGGIIQNVDLKNRTIEVDDPFGLHNYNLDLIVDVTVLE